MSDDATLIERILEQYGTPFGDRAAEKPCEGSRFHSPQPLTTQTVGIGDRMVALCPTCSAKLQVFIYLAETMSPDDFTWPVQREFGNRIRALGQEQLSSYRQAPASENDDEWDGRP